MEFDFSDVEKVINEITEKHADKIRDNEVFAQLLNKLSESNDKKNAILEELATACKMNYEYTKEVLKHSKNLSSIVRLIDTRLSALEITVAHIEKGNEKWLEYVDNLQDQIDILAGELSEITTTFPIKKEN